MGEIADAVLSGFFCDICGVMVDGDEPGYPRLCGACKEEEELREELRR